MSYKNIIGKCLLYGIVILWVVTESHSVYAQHGWEVFWIVPCEVLAFLAFVALINWLLE